jgi:hypothetical protein
MLPLQARRQRNLFEESPVVPAVRPPREVQEQLRRQLVRWLQALARMIRVEDGREQDHR